MSIRFSGNPQPIPDPETESQSGSESEESGDDDQGWDDWCEDEDQKQPCQSLFEDKVLGSVEDALKHDKEVHGFDLDALVSKLGTSFLLLLNTSTELVGRTGLSWTGPVDQLYPQKREFRVFLVKR